MKTSLPLYNRAFALGVSLALAVGMAPGIALADPSESASSSSQTTASTPARTVPAAEGSSSSSSSAVVVPGAPTDAAQVENADGQSAEQSAEDAAKAAEAQKALEQMQAKAAQVAAVFKLIDEYQTKLNDANAAFDQANAAYEEANAAVAEAQAKLDEQTARIEELKTQLNQLAVEMYKQDTGGDYLSALLNNGSFEEMVTSWEAISAVTGKNADMVREAKEARTNYEIAKETLRVKSEDAEREKEAAAQAQAQAAAMYNSLMEQASALTGEMLSDTSVWEYTGDAARQAEVARIVAEDALRRVGNLTTSSGKLLENPCPGAVESSGFGYREFDNSFHAGLDMAAAEGTPYYAAESGTVIFATNDGSYNGGAGNWVVISHGNGVVSKYMHSLATVVKPGDRVVRGQLLGLVGNTGQSFGAHLHFQVEVNGSPIDPRSFI